MTFARGAASNTGLGRAPFGNSDLRPSRRTMMGFALVAGLARSTRAFAAVADVSDWVATDHARVRLIDAGVVDGGRLAGLQIELDPGFLTYWRTPGEAGVPPTTAFDGSTNLATATLTYPAPTRIDEGGSDAFGYEEGVVFPIRVVPADPGKPVMLAVALSFAVCSTLCLPASANVRLDLKGRGDSPEAGLVRAAQGRVPVPLPTGAPGPLAILSVASDPAVHRAQVVARVPADANPTLFVESPEPWFIRAGAGQALGDGRTRFDLEVLDGARTPTEIAVIMTLATGAGAIETIVQLDAAAPAP